MTTVPFVERVCDIAISQAIHYKRVFVDKEYLICSSVFTNQPYYIKRDPAQCPKPLEKHP